MSQGAVLHPLVRVQDGALVGRQTEGRLLRPRGFLTRCGIWCILHTRDEEKSRSAGARMSSILGFGSRIKICVLYRYNGSIIISVNY